jgi:hypothetical protein
MPLSASVSLAAVYCCVLVSFSTTSDDPYSLMKHAVSHKPCPTMYIACVRHPFSNPYLIFMTFRELAVHSSSDCRTSLQ